MEVRKDLKIHATERQRIRIVDDSPVGKGLLQEAVTHTESMHRDGPGKNHEPSQVGKPVGVRVTCPRILTNWTKGFLPGEQNGLHTPRNQRKLKEKD
jgi:hypothetical protein